jgi:hypothetical protein
MYELNLSECIFNLRVIIVPFLRSYVLTNVLKGSIVISSVGWTSGKIKISNPHVKLDITNRDGIRDNIICIKSQSYEIRSYNIYI